MKIANGAGFAESEDHRVLRVATVQMESTPGDKMANLAVMESFIIDFSVNNGYYSHHETTWKS
jgi:hypothetical protein